MIETLFDVLGNFYHEGNFSEAERIAGIITQVVPDDDVSMQLSGLLCYRMGRREEAIQAFNRAATSSFASGLAAHHDDRLSAALQCRRAARRHGSTLAGAWYDLGLVLFRLRRDQQAISAFQSAISVRPDFRAAQRAIERIAELSCRQGLPSPGRNAAATVTSLAPDAMQAHRSKDETLRRRWG